MRQIKMRMSVDQHWYQEMPRPINRLYSIDPRTLEPLPNDLPRLLDRPGQ